MLSSDKPLSDPAQDKLGYANFAHMLAKSIVKMTPTDGLVMALYGEWGSGKSTVIKFIEEYLKSEEFSEVERPVILEFNPWWFTNTNDLIRSFFDQLLNKLKQRQFGRAIKSVAGKVKLLAEKVSQAPGGELAGYAATGIGMMLGDTDVQQLKTDIKIKLNKTNKRLLIVIDDIDRLRRDEMLQLFTVIKAIADFPNVIYLLSFDKNVVEQELHPNGEAYLEKIVQVPFQLPLPNTDAVLALLLDQISTVFGAIPQDFHSPNRFEQSYARFIASIAPTPRQILRLVNAVRVSWGALKDEVYAADLIAIEAIRLFAPEVYEQIRRSNHLLLVEEENVFVTEKDKYSALIKSIQNQPQIIREFVFKMFPKANSQRFFGRVTTVTEAQAYRRISDKESFDIYFSFQLPEIVVPVSEIEALIQLLTEPEKLEAKLLEYVDQDIIRTERVVQKFVYRLKVPLTQLQLSNAFYVVFKAADAFLKPLVAPDSGNRILNLFSHFIYDLLERQPSQTRCELFVRGYDDGNSPFLTLDLVDRFAYQHGLLVPNAKREAWDRLIPEDDMGQIMDVGFSAIEKVIQHPLFFELPTSGKVIFFWLSQKPLECKAWIEKQTKQEDKLIWFLMWLEDSSLREKAKRVFDWDKLRFTADQLRIRNYKALSEQQRDVVMRFLSQG